MKNLLFLAVLCAAFFAIGITNSCKKETMGPPNPPPPDTSAITENYTEEFADVSLITQAGWVMGENTVVGATGSTAWSQGNAGSYKGDTAWYGFPAYSYTSSSDEYIYSYEPYIDSTFSISSWLITPVLSVKNGDKISFYTRGDTTGVYTDRMQVLMNKKPSVYFGADLNSVGDFTTMLDDINAEQAPGGYPTKWTKYEYTFSGFAGATEIRVAFRHYVLNPTNARGIGIDQFKFEVN